MDWFLPIFQTVGAGLGFLSTAITIWAYATKERPTAIIVGEPVKGWGRRNSYLRVKNRSDRPILLHLEGGKYRDEFTVWPDHDTESAAHGMRPGATTTIAVDPQSELELPLIRPTLFDDIPNENEIVASVRWSYAQPLLFRPSRPLRISISKRAYTAVVDGVLRDFRGDA